MEQQYAAYWLAAATAGFATHEDWASWADVLIQRADMPENWILDLSLARDTRELWSVLGPKAMQEASQSGGEQLIWDAMIGYVWLRHIRGDINLEECLKLAGDLADNYDTSIECESFYALGMRIGKVAGIEASVEVEKEAKTLFAPFGQLAASHWKTLNKAKASGVDTGIDSRSI